MLVIPAIDIKDGRCVRLRQGLMSRETIYSQEPEEMARRWLRSGAERLHLVDLNGAVQGKPVNRDSIKKIVAAVPIPVQLGGGIRDLKTVEAYLDLGISQVILGTAAYRDPDFVLLACQKFPQKVILGIDARKGRISVEGWTEQTRMTPVELALKFESSDIYAIVYTDIERDGMSTGPNIDSTMDFAGSVNTPVIASGGISGIDDVKKVLALEEYGVMGMITGRALYQGDLDLAEAIKVAKRLPA